MNKHLNRISKAGMSSILALSLVTTSLLPSVTLASSHREAPLISADQQADASDLYAFVSPDKPDTVTFIANYVPLQVPAAGPNFYKFGDDVLYEINIDNNGDAKDDITYQFDFSSSIKNGKTFLYNTGPITSIDDPDLNVRQNYSVSILKGKQNNTTAHKGTVISGASKLPVAPANVGAKSYPDGYNVVAEGAVKTIGKDIKVFAGPRDDAFFVDLGGIFDLVSGISGADHVYGTNVHTIALQVPISQLTANGKAPKDMTDPNAIIGVRTTSYRKSTSVLRDAKAPGMHNSGHWVQVSRLDNPLVNEVVIPLKDKDRWNASLPKNDTQFLSYVTHPELAGLMTAILGVKTPPAPRNDLVTIFLTGIDGLNKPAKVTPSSQLRLNMGVAPAFSPNRLGVLGGDNAGFPNGRRLTDDVTDIALQAVAGGTPFTPDFNKAPNNAIGDGVDKNDKVFLGSFPYAAEPHAYTGKAAQ